MQSNNLKITSVYQAHIEEREEKTAMVDPEFYLIPAMNTDELKGSNFKLWHIFTRTVAHGFHYRICDQRGYHHANVKCSCILCYGSCQQYHLFYYQARTNSLAYYANAKTLNNLSYIYFFYVGLHSVFNKAYY